MQFIPQLKDFLKENGSIYTIRGYDMDHKWVKVEGVGWCERFPLGPINNTNDLKPFYKQSGFETLEDWIIYKRGKSYVVIQSRGEKV